MKSSLKKLWRAIRWRRHFVIADPRDNSVTFSKQLYRRIVRDNDLDRQAKVLGFYSDSIGLYGFIINPDVVESTIMADIQFDSRTRTIGYESLCPTVNQICYRFNLPFDRPVKLTVTALLMPDGKTAYIMHTTWS